jgi:hypothetical protein
MLFTLPRQQELQEIRELSWKLGLGKRLSLPDLWKKRVERAKDSMFHHWQPHSPKHGVRMMMMMMMMVFCW